MAKAKKENIIDTMKAELGTEPGATLEKYLIEFANESDESTYYYMVLPLALAKYRKDHPEARFESEVIHYSDGKSAAVKAKIFKGPNPSDFAGDGYGEAVANGLTDAPLVMAHHRALSNALKHLGYTVPYWKSYEKIIEGNLPEEGTEKGVILAEARELLAGVETHTDGITPGIDAEPKKRRTRAKKDAEPAKPAVKMVDECDIPDDFIPEVDDVPEVYTPEAAAKKTVWELIPDVIDVNDIPKYISQITEEDIKGVKIPFGKCSGRTIEDVASSPSDKDMLRFYSQSSRLKGTKVQLALLRACEIYGC